MAGFIRFAFFGEVQPPRRLEVAERRIAALADEVERLSGHRPRTGIVEAHDPLPSHVRGWRQDVVQPDIETLKERTQAAVVRLASWTMLLLLLGSLVGIVVLEALGRKSPDILTVGVSSPLGYFGGLLSAYFGVQGR